MVDRMRVLGDSLVEESSGGIAAHIANHSVEHGGTWAMDVEMYALAHLLRVHLYCYCVHVGGWQQMKPTVIDSRLDSSEHQPPTQSL